jgi:Fe(3+) dicitrate transport protein
LLTSATRSGFATQRDDAILKDGVSIKNEQFGFPETHYAPISMRLSGSKSSAPVPLCKYGPQAGRAINFVTKMPRNDAQFHFDTKNAFGTDEFYQDFTEIDGTIGQFGYYAYYDHRQAEWISGE